MLVRKSRFCFALAVFGEKQAIVCHDRLRTNITHKEGSNTHTGCGGGGVCSGAHPDLFGSCVLPNPNVTSARSEPADGQQSLAALAGDASLLEQHSNVQQHGCCGACAAGFCEPGAPPDGDCPPGVPPTPVDGPPWWLPPINNCDYDMAGDMLTFLHAAATTTANGGSARLRPRQQALSAHLLAFPQGKYIASNMTVDAAAMDATGFVYVPADCSAPGKLSACEVHVHYHPCGGNWQETR